MPKTSTRRGSPVTGRILVIWATLTVAVTSSLASAQPVEAAPPPPSSAFIDRTVNFGYYSAFAVAVDHARNILYVTNNYGMIRALDATTLGLISAASTVSSPTHLDVDQTTGNIYIAHQGVGDRITVLNPSLVKIAEIPVTNPFSPVVNELTHRAYFAQTYGGGIEVIDTTTNTWVTRVPTPGASIVAVAIDAGRNLVFAVDRYDDTMSIMDGATNTIITTVATGLTPMGVAVDEVLDKVYVTNSNSDSVSVYRGSTGALLGTIATSSPYAVAVNAQDHHAYVTNFYSDTVSVIDTSVDVVVKVLNTPTSQPFQVAVHPQDHAAYFTTLYGGSVSRILDVPVTDSIAPSIVFDSPAQGGAYDLGETVPVTYSCTDDQALASCDGDLPNGATLDTSTPGTFTFDVTATDVAGNLVTETHTYEIEPTFAAGLGLTGSITTIPADYVVTIADAADPSEGVTITVAGSGTEKVRLTVCGGFAVAIAPGSTVTLTCGSIEAIVHTGSVELVDPSGVSTVQVPEGGAATLEENGDVVNSGPTPITVTAAGITQVVVAGSSSAWHASGFYAPVDMGGVWNSMKAGSTVPLKFEVFFGAIELTDPAEISISLTRAQCTTGTEDAVEQFATSGASGVTYANGQFQANWKSPRLPGACFRVTVDGGGISLTAYFKLK